LQIIGPQQDHDEKEIQEHQLVRDEVIDGGYAKKNEEGKNLFRIFEQIVLEVYMS
jgi:hypothetical protein